MQALTASPRNGLTSAQVTSLLTGPQVTITAGLERLSPSLALLEDISADMVAGGSVTRDMKAEVHGGCTLQLTRAFGVGIDLVKPYLTLTSGSLSARFNLGVFGLTTPERKVGESVQSYSVTGYDRLYYLQRPVGDTYSVAAGANYLTAIATAFTAAGLVGVTIDQSSAAKTLPTDKVWPLTGDSPVTWLQIINELLLAINYRDVWADQDGQFRCEPYILPENRAAEFTFDTGAVTIVGEERTLVEDVWSIPNRWVFRHSNRDPILGEPIAGDGLFIYTLPAAHPQSAASRGVTWNAVRDLEASDQATLEATALTMIATDLRIASTLTLTTGPFPVAGHADVFTYDDPAVGAVGKVQATSWDLPLDGGDTVWAWERV